MKIDVFFSPAVVDEASVEGRTAVVIDVIRATSTLLEALALSLIHISEPKRPTT